MAHFSPLIHLFLALAFILGYLAIIFEYYIKINKTASALLMAVVTWVLLFMEQMGEPNSDFSILDAHVANAAQIVFFLLGAMTLVELIDIHRGFKIITDFIHTRSKKKMLWIIGFIAFFLSSILDNLTTTIVMVSLIRKLIGDPKDRAVLGSATVIATNAGGVWTPIGDVTTTMLWIKGQLTTLALIKMLFLPSFFALLVALFFLSFQMTGAYTPLKKEHHVTPEPGATIVFFSGIGALVFVPIFKAVTGLPPFMGILAGVGVLWLITDLMHHRYETRKHLRVPHIFTRIDTSGVLFFFGILLSINSLEVVGILKNIALWLGAHISNLAVVATLIGIFSAIVDNVPLVAACMGMYSLESFPTDSALWHMIAYTAGTGGSILIIGSAAGVALMGMEKIDFIWYLKKISLTALTSFVAGMALYLFLSFI